MIALLAGARVGLATGPADMHKDFDGLACWYRRSSRVIRMAGSCSCSAAGAAVSSSFLV
jgi:hypothetical protein